MILLLDIGNTHTHLGLANSRRIVKQRNIPTLAWAEGKAVRLLNAFVRRAPLEGAAICSVVPKATPLARRAVHKSYRLNGLELTAKTARGIGINYPCPKMIGPDRLANAIAAKSKYGSPVVVVDFGTAVTFDVVDRAGDYVGGVIAPGLSAMTTYLHEKTALLPEITIREVEGVIGKSTEEAMLIGAVHGYRGLVSQLVSELKGALLSPRLPVVATGGYAELISRQMPEIAAVDPMLTLEGLRLFWVSWQRDET